jgi:predicted permease
LAFVTVIGSALALAGAWLAIAEPLLPSRLPFREPDRLVAIETLKKGLTGGLNWKDLEDLRTPSVEAIAGFLPRTWGMQTEAKGHVEVVLSQQVTGEFFDVLGVMPYLGEPLTRRHEQSGSQQYVWLTYSSWTRLLGSARDAVGKVVWINSVPYRVAGVLPPLFAFPYRGESADIYIPLNRADYFELRGPGSLGTIARLRPRAHFVDELAARSQALASQVPGVAFRARDLNTVMLGDRLKLLRWLLAAVVVVLLVAMANGSGIWLAQWLRQQRQVSIQLALGASLGRVWRDQAAQAVVLGVAAAGLGFAGATALLSSLRASTMLGPELARFEVWSHSGLSATTVFALVAVALLTSLVSVAIPMLAVRAAGLPARTSVSRSSGRVRLVLAVAQLTLTGVLAYTGILIARNVQTLFAADRRFKTEQILVAGIGIPEAKYNTDERMIQFHQRAIEELARIPGVNMAAGGIQLPVGATRTRFLLDAENVPRDEQRMARFGVASEDLLPLLSIPLVKGRAFNPGDRWGAPRVALVNQAFANRYLNGQEALGHRLRVSFYNGFAMKPYEEHVIVGVLANTLNQDLALESEPQIVISSNQIALEGFNYYLRTTLPAEALRRAAQEAIWRVDPELQGVALKPLAERVEQSLVARGRLAWLAALFGSIAALIVAFGLGSSLSATFLEMTRELGIRAALGATPWQLASASVRWGLWAIGLSWLLTLPIVYLVNHSLVLDRQDGDLASWALTGVTLALIGIAAAYVPARRAAAVNPASTLRAE